MYTHQNCSTDKDINGLANDIARTGFAILTQNGGNHAKLSKLDDSQFITFSRTPSDDHAFNAMKRDCQRVFPEYFDRPEAVKEKVVDTTEYFAPPSPLVDVNNLSIDALQAILAQKLDQKRVEDEKRVAQFRGELDAVNQEIMELDVMLKEAHEKRQVIREKMGLKIGVRDIVGDVASFETAYQGAVRKTNGAVSVQATRAKYNLSGDFGGWMRKYHPSEVIKGN